MIIIINLLTIGGNELPVPRTYKVNRSDIDSADTKRGSETGILHRRRIREGVYKIQATWRVTQADLKNITDVISDTSFTVMFFDPTTFDMVTVEMYAGDRSCSMVLNAEATEETWWDFSVNFIEY